MPKLMFTFILLLTACGTGSDLPADAGSGELDDASAETPSAYVSFNLPPNADCVVDTKGSKFIGIGIYDIASKTAERHGLCNKPYSMSLLLNANVRPDDPTPVGDGPNPIQVHSAQIRLLTLDGEAIAFDGAGPKLPNPYETTAQEFATPRTDEEHWSSLVAVPAIPASYAAQLGPYVGEQLLVEVTVHAQTWRNEAIEVQPFKFPVEICDGCLTRCNTELVGSMTDPESMHDGQCPDNAGADGRVCIDPDC